MPYLLAEPEALDEEPAPAAPEELDEPLSPPDCFWVLLTWAAPVPLFSLQSLGRSALFGYFAMSHLSASLRATCFGFLPDLSFDCGIDPEVDPYVVPALDAVVEDGDVVFVEAVPLNAAVLPIDVPVAADEVSVLLVVGEVADEDGAGVLAEVPAMLDEVEDVVVSAFGAFLSLCMSPRANAEPLARATMVVMTKAGASLRIWSS